MALPETSPLDAALIRIIGEPPGTTVSLGPVQPPSTAIGAPPGTNVSLGAPQPVTPEPPAPVYTPPVPVSAPAPAPAPAPVAATPAPPVWQYERPAAATLEEWNVANKFAPTQSTWMTQFAGPQAGKAAFNPYQMYLNEYNKAATAGGAAPAVANDFNKPVEVQYPYSFGGTPPPAPTPTFGEWRRGQGIRRQAWQSMARPERQELRGQYAEAF